MKIYEFLSPDFPPENRNENENLPSEISRFKQFQEQASTSFGYDTFGGWLVKAAIFVAVKAFFVVSPLHGPDLSLTSPEPCT